MASLQSGQSMRRPLKSLKYKRKFYEADDYLPWNADTINTTGNDSPQNREKRLCNFTDKDACKGSDKTLIGSAQSEKAIHSKSANESHEGFGVSSMCVPEVNSSICTRPNDQSTEAFLSTLHTPQSTQEICVALLNMAFWRPEIQDNKSNYQGSEGQRNTRLNDQRQSISEQRDQATVSSNPVGDLHMTSSHNVESGKPLPKRYCWVLSTDDDRTPANESDSYNGNTGIHSVESICRTGSLRNDVTSQQIAGTANREYGQAGVASIADTSLSPSRANALMSPNWNPSENNASSMEESTSCNSKHDSHAEIESETGIKHTSMTTRTLDASHQCVLPSQSTVSTSFHDTLTTQHNSPYTVLAIPHIPLALSPVITPDSLVDLASGLVSPLVPPTPSQLTAPTKLPAAQIEAPSPTPDILSPNIRNLNTVSSLFTRPAKGRVLWEIVEMMARRHKEDYFTSWSKEKILDLELDERPNIFPITAQVKKDLLSKSVVTENKKLAFSWYSEEDWGIEFRHRLRTGVFKTLSEAKRDASQLWRVHCPNYDETRAVRLRDDDGNIVMKRTRAKSGSEFEYRQNLRKAKVNTIVDQIWSKRSIIASTLCSSHMNTIMREIEAEYPEYKQPRDHIHQLADIIAFTLKKELLSVNSDAIS